MLVEKVGIPSSTGVEKEGRLKKKKGLFIRWKI